MITLTERKRALAKEALKLAEGQIRRKLPALAAAFGVPGTEWTDRASGTDAQILYWNPDEVLNLFRKGPAKLERRYLHLLLHGLYLHAFRQYRCPERIWWLACDMVTEYRIDRMHVPGFPWPIPGERSRWYRKMREERVVFQERELAGWLELQDKETLGELELLFRGDDHTCWREEESVRERHREDRAYQAEKTRLKTEAVHRWRIVFEQTGLRQEEHRRQAGGSAGARTEQIILQKERGYDYRQFLKQFAVEQEELSLDMDSFDPIPYDYSRRMYERLVFLEPLEYRDMRRLQEFVIAIDTSGSCSGEVVRRFLEETWEIFREKDNFFRDMRIHLIQCDCMVQEHVCVTCEEEWEAYLRQMTVKGHGDTDFTPVFRLVDRLIESRELNNLKGLLYFTDGDGIYPDRRPEYDTAFVFLNEELQKGKAPAWAQTLTLDMEESV